uniref:Cytochrome P450 n=1 Tax=Leersia perrieri TaxID=77586 RepID=A0A0D9X601_9ORYZ
MAFTSMGELFCTSLLLAVLLYFIIEYKKSKNQHIPTKWPIVGMLPALMSNLHNIHDFLAAVLAAAGRNFELRGPPGSTVRFFTTSDPENVRHIFTTNFANYPKGENFAEVFGALAGTIFTVDGEAWRRQRTSAHRVLTRLELLSFMERSCHDKVADYLVPLLERMASNGTPFDMEDLLGRLVMDLTIKIVFGMDRCIDMPPTMQIAGALDTIMEVAFYRHMMPAFSWKLMKKLNIGHEKKYDEAEAFLRSFVRGRITRRIAGEDDDNKAAIVDILSHYIDDPIFRDDAGEPTDLFIRSFINFLVALRDPISSALPWLVYNLATHPQAVSALRDELAPIAEGKSSTDGSDATIIFDPQDTRHLVYQKAALFESLRLYPVGPIERKSVVADDVLPSGHTVRAGDTVLVSVYGMGRLEDVWGTDCREYRPERWLTDDGDGGGNCKLRHVPSYKFMPFNTGPRSCLGKRIAVATITPVVATLFWNFDVEVMDSHAVESKLSIVMQMKNGFMVKLKERVRNVS